MRHTFWSCLIRCIKYEMDPTRTVGAIADTRCGTDGRTEWNQYTPQQLRCIMTVQFMHVQLSAVILQSNMTWYCTDHCRNEGRISIRVWSHKRHLIPHPNGRAIRCLLWIFWRNWPYYNGTGCVYRPQQASMSQSIILNQITRDKTQYIDSTTSEVTLITTQNIRSPHHVQTKVDVMVMKRRLTPPSYHVSLPSHSWDKASLNFDPENSRSRSWV